MNHSTHWSTQEFFSGLRADLALWLWIRFLRKAGMSQVAPGLVAPIVAGLDRLLIAKMGQDFVYEVLLLNAPVRRIGDDSDRSPQRPVPGELRCPLAGGVEQASFGACHKVKSSNLRKSKSFPTIRVENREKLMKTRPKLWQNYGKTMAKLPKVWGTQTEKTQ